MDDYLEIFLEEQKVKVAAEKALLEQDPPYMEIRTRTCDGCDSSRKENIPPGQEPYHVQVKAGLSLPLGDDYERKKQRLQQELCQDYRCYMEQVQDHRSTSRTAPVAPDVPLSPRPPVPRESLASMRDVATLTETKSGAPRGRSWLTEEETLQSRLRGTVIDSDSVLDGSEEEMDFPDQGRNSRRHRVADRRRHRFRYRTDRMDEHSKGLGLCEGHDNGERRIRELCGGHDDYRERGGLELHRERALKLHEGHDDYNERRLGFFGGHKEYRGGRGLELLGEHEDYRERRSLELHRNCDDHRDGRALEHHEGHDDYSERRRLGVFRGHKEYRGGRDMALLGGREDYRTRKGLELHGVHEDYRGGRKNWKLPKEPQEPFLVQSRERSRCGVDSVKAEFVTGLMIGMKEAEEDQRRRKERYRLELQEQIAQQRRNRKREKDLELHVAATGVNDPEKRPDRIPQLSSGWRAVQQRPWSRLGNVAWRSPPHGHLPEEQEPPEQSHVAFQSPVLKALAGMREGRTTPLKEDPQKRRWNNLGLSSPSVPPVPASTLSDSYRPLSDKAQNYHGARRWLNPSWSCQGMLHNELQGVPPYTVAQEASTLGALPVVGDWTGTTPLAGRNKQAKDAVQSYRDELKQQIQEREEQRRQEEEQRKCSEAKLEEEMKAYNPWGRGGGGAPLRDQLGNLIADLNQMHKSNEEAYLHPESRDHWRPGPETLSSPLRFSGHTSAEIPPSVLDSVSAELSTPQPLCEQDKYKEFLRQQIEEKRQRQAAERERQRLVDEKDDKRVAMERAKMLREFEEEQEKKKKKEMELKAKNEELLRQAEERRREEQRRLEEQQRQEEQRRQQEEKHRQEEQQRQRKQEDQRKRERQSQPEEVSRQPPPFTTQQRRQASQFMPRPPSADHRYPTAPQSEQSVRPPRSPPVPARRNQLRAEEERQDILNKLSALSRRLRAEQRRLEEQLLQADVEERALPPRVKSRESPLLEAFDMTRLSLQAPVRRPISKTMESVNIHKDLKLLEWKGSDRPEEHISRGPQGRDPSLSCLRGEQHAAGNRLPKKSIRDDGHVWAGDEQTCRLSVEPSLQSSLLESESTFIGPRGQPLTIACEPERTSRLSARERRRLARRTDAIDEVRPSESDLSMEMVNKECRVRPDTSDNLKHLLTSQNPGQCLSSRSLMPTWDGPSTYHG